MTLNLSADQLARLQKNLGASVADELPAKPPKREPEKREPKPKVYEWIWRTKWGMMHRFRQVDEHRTITACMREVYTPTTFVVEVDDAVARCPVCLEAEQAEKEQPK